MIFIIILLIFNLVIIILLANVKCPKFPDVFKYKVYPTLKMTNNSIEYSDLEIDKYHSIFEEKKFIEGEDDGQEGV